MIVVARVGWFMVLMLLMGCVEAEQGGKKMVASAQISPSEWQALAKKRVVFGHQSVGQNILSGVQSLAAQAGVDLPIIKLGEPVSKGGIVEFPVGQNGDPLSKFKDFASTLEKGAAQNADIALMKICFVDINGNTDAKKVAEQYGATLDRLSQQFPKTTFIAVTSPLTVAQTGPKAWIKSLLRTPGAAADLRRREFNDVLRARYGQQGRLFDLAKIEAEGVIGDYQYEGQPIEVLNPSFASDGGHLNAEGQQRVAARFIKFLAALP